MENISINVLGALQKQPFVQEKIFLLFSNVIFQASHLPHNIDIRNYCLWGKNSTTRLSLQEHSK